LTDASQPSADSIESQLILRACEVRKFAYAPYSRFAVGAALATPCGQIFAGVNVENGSFGMTICAERSAIAAAVSAGFREFTHIAICTTGGHMPCGACRQVLAEFGDMLVLAVDSETGTVTRVPMAELLPRGFRFTQT
jgi:cytidine deaminase